MVFFSVATGFFALTFKLSQIQLHCYATIQTSIMREKTLENTEGAIKMDNTRHTRRRQTKQKHNTICAGHHYAQTNRKTEYRFYAEIVADITTRNSKRKDT